MNLENSDFTATIECLKRSSLTPDQVTNLVRRYQKVQKGYRRWYVDWRLLDSFKEVFGNPRYSYSLDQVHRSAVDRKFTKYFCDWSLTNENVDKFLDQEYDRPDFRFNRNFKVARTFLENMLGTAELVPAKLESVDDAYSVWSNKSASAGAIGRGSKDDNSQECFEGAKRIERRIKSGESFADIQIPSTPGHRSQLSNYVVDGEYSPSTVKEKNRFVFCIDGATVTIEGKYASVLIPHIVSHWYGYSGGDSSISLRAKIREASLDKNFLSVDYSKFDQTVQSWLIRECFEILKGFFAPYYYREIDWICYNFINTKILLHGGKLVSKSRGIPSGSNFTQIIGSMCNALMMLTYISSRCEGCSFEEKLSYVEKELSPMYGDGPSTMFVMGDDNLCFTHTKLDLDSMSKYVWRFFGVKINPDKCATSDSSKYPEYLKREWRGNGEYRDVTEMIINMIHPERESIS